VPSVSTQINCPASDVFRFVCDWRNYESLWDKSIQIMTPDSLVSTRLGQSTEFAHASGKVVVHAVATVVRFEEFSLVEWDTTFPKVINAGREENPPLPDVLVTFEFSGNEAMTRLKVSWKIHGDYPLAMKLITGVGMLFQRRKLAKGLRRIKMQLESPQC
jgi:hypothetical protein